MRVTVKALRRAVRAVMSDAGCRVKDIAERIGYSQPYFSSVLSGKNPVTKALADAFRTAYPGYIGGGQYVVVSLGMESEDAFFGILPALAGHYRIIRFVEPSGRWLAEDGAVPAVHGYVELVHACDDGRVDMLQRWLKENGAGDGDVAFVVEDSARIASAWRREGFICFSY